MATNKDKKEQTAQAAPDETVTTAPDPVEEAKKEAQAILDAAKAEAEKIKREAQEKAEADAKAAFDAAKAELEAAAAAEQSAAPVQAEGHMVPVYLFKDNGKYKDDVFVAVNGKSYQIKRGEKVMVPDFVAEVLEQSMSQDQATANLISRQSEEYAAEAARLGV